MNLRRGFDHDATTMSRVLLVSSSFYPLNSPGSHRMAHTARYLPAFGWNPSILCLDWRGWKQLADPTLCDWNWCPVIRAFNPHRRRWTLRWITSALGRRMEEHLLPGITPTANYRAMIRSGVNVIGSFQPDVIVGTYPPFVNLAAAGRLARSSGLPWVADLRDLPDEFGDHDALRVRRAVRVETKLCRDAAALITVSEPLAAQLRSRHDAPVSVVLNGFNEDDFSGPPPCRDETVFEIVYAGKLDEYRKARAILDPLASLIIEGSIDPSKLRISFFGRVYGEFLRNLEGHPCEASVVHHGFVPHGESLRRQRAADVLLFLSHRSGIGIFTSKIFEYLAAGRPILSIPGDNGVTDRILAETRSGHVARTPEAVMSALRTLYREWLEHGQVDYHGDTDSIQQYSRRNQTSSFARILGSVVA